MLDFEELPESYGVDECEVLYKDPFWVFAYWEVTDGGLGAARAQLGQSADGARLVLRLFTTVPQAEGVFKFNKGPNTRQNPLSQDDDDEVYYALGPSAL